MRRQAPRRAAEEAREGVAEAGERLEDVRVVGGRGLRGAGGLVVCRRLEVEEGEVLLCEDGEVGADVLGLLAYVLGHGGI